MRRKTKRSRQHKTPTPPPPNKGPCRRPPAGDVPARPNFDSDPSDSSSAPCSDRRRLPATCYSLQIDSSGSEDAQQHDGNPKQRIAMAYSPPSPGEPLLGSPAPPMARRLSNVSYRLNIDDTDSSGGSSSSSADDSPAAVDSPAPPIPSFAASRVTATTRPLCNMPANRLRRERYAEQKLLANALSTGDDILLTAAVNTKTGAKRMPVLAAALGDREHFKELARNTVEAMGK
jgi:hypothetical protein